MMTEPLAETNCPQRVRRALVTFTDSRDASVQERQFRADA